MKPKAEIWLVKWKDAAVTIGQDSRTYEEDQWQITVGVFVRFWTDKDKIKYVRLASSFDTSNEHDFTDIPVKLIVWTKQWTTNIPGVKNEKT